MERFPPNETPMMPMPPEEWEKPQNGQKLTPRKKQVLEALSNDARLDIQQR